MIQQIIFATRRVRVITQGKVPGSAHWTGIGHASGWAVVPGRRIVYFAEVYFTEVGIGIYLPGVPILTRTFFVPDRFNVL